MASIASPFASFTVAALKHSPRSGPHGNFRPISIRSSSASSTSSSLYEVLGIQTGATCQEIKAAYRKLARVLHPDANYNEPNDTSSNYEFIKLHEAYETLSDPDKRAEYDRSLFWRGISPFVMSAATVSPMAGTSPAATASGFSGYNRRRWETDQCW